MAIFFPVWVGAGVFTGGGAPRRRECSPGGRCLVFRWSCCGGEAAVGVFFVSKGRAKLCLFFRCGLIEGGPWGAGSIIRAGVPAIGLNPGGRAELWRFFSRVLWAWGCRRLLVFGTGLGGFVAGPFGVQEQMCCCWWGCGKVHWAGGGLSFFVL